MYIWQFDNSDERKSSLCLSHYSQVIMQGSRW